MGLLSTLTSAIGKVTSSIINSTPTGIKSSLNDLLSGSSTKYNGASGYSGSSSSSGSSGSSLLTSSSS